MGAVLSPDSSLCASGWRVGLEGALRYEGLRGQVAETDTITTELELIMTDGNSAISPRHRPRAMKLQESEGLCGLPICKAIQCRVNGWRLGTVSGEISSTSAAVEREAVVEGMMRMYGILWLIKIATRQQFNWFRKLVNIQYG